MRSLLYIIVSTFIFTAAAKAQAPKQVVQMAKIVVDPAHLETYKALLKEEIETAIKAEAGVLTLNAVYEKGQPNHVTVLGIYASEEAYNAYLQSPHYTKYKTDSKDMIKSLELINMEPAAVEAKSKK
jgi:4-carboxymuconolactone decarboxylase